MFEPLVPIPRVTHLRIEDIRGGDRSFTTAERHKMAHSGEAMPDGSYPIANASDLHNAILAYGHHAVPAVKEHIKRRAAALGKTSMLPKNW